MEEQADGRQDHRTARAIRAARSLSRSRVWLVPEKTSMSPDLALRTCTTIGSEWCSPTAVSATGEADALVAASAGLAVAAPRAVTARPAAPAVAAPCSSERRDKPRSVLSAARFAS